MARLSRTAKYAELRNQMSQDRETSVYTEELGKFEDKLKGIQNNASGINENILNRGSESAPLEAPNATYIESVPESVPEVAPEVVQEVVQEVVEPAPVKVEEIVPEQKPEPAEVPSFEEATKEFKPEEANVDFFEFLNSLDTTNLEKDIQESIDSVPETEPIIEAPSKEPEIINEVHEGLEEIVEHIEQDNVEINGVVEQVEVEEEKPVINNDFMNEAMKEVNDYNRNDGRKTIDELSTSFVDAVRHPENNELFKSDDEFSNTVSLEIDKVLNEIKTETAAAVKEVVQEAIAQTQESATIVEDIEPIVKEADVVEIKPMEETLRHDVLDDTIPFVMNNSEVVEDYEDEAPNKILNVILVVLIIILLAILGVIVYYILYAKGIIG